MNRIPVVSSNIYSVGFSKGILEIEFRSGGVYRYFDVPKHVYDELMDAESLGSFFHYNIKGNYEYERIA
jgi:hypothetical protein